MDGELPFVLLRVTEQMWRGGSRHLGIPSQSSPAIQNTSLPASPPSLLSSVWSHRLSVLTPSFLLFFDLDLSLLLLLAVWALEFRCSVSYPRPHPQGNLL